MAEQIDTISAGHVLSHPDISQPDDVSLDPVDREAVDKLAIATVSKTAINDFLARVDYSDPDYPRDPELELRVKEVSRFWDFGKPIEANITMGTLFAEMAYSHITNIDLKVAIAVVTTLGSCIDDPEILDKLPYDDFLRKFCNGTAQDDTRLLGAFARCLADMSKYFPPFAVGTIFVSIMQFINATILENVTKDAVLSTGALPFVEYRRFISGVPEAFVCFIWEGVHFPDVKVYMQAIPDACLFLNYANDIMSFYKEEIGEDVANYIRDRARVTGKSSLDTLREVIDQTVDAADRVRIILGEGAARDAWDRFAMRFIKFHCTTPRYRLAEILGDTYIADPTAHKPAY